MINEWPASNVQSPVYIQEIPHAWGFAGARDRTGYEVIYMGRPSPHGMYTSYEPAAAEASRVFTEHGLRAERIRQEAEKARQEVRAQEERFSPFSLEEKAECRDLAATHYWRFNDIQFHPTGIRVISEDQGGHPFQAFVIDIAAEAEVVRRCCLAAMRGLK